MSEPRTLYPLQRELALAMKSIGRLYTREQLVGLTNAETAAEIDSMVAHGLAIQEDDPDGKNPPQFALTHEARDAYERTPTPVEEV